MVFAYVKHPDTVSTFFPIFTMVTRPSGCRISLRIQLSACLPCFTSTAHSIPLQSDSTSIAKEQADKWLQSSWACTGLEQLWRRHVAQWTAWAPHAGVAIRAAWPRSAIPRCHLHPRHSVAHNSAPKLRKRAR